MTLRSGCFGLVVTKICAFMSKSRNSCGTDQRHLRSTTISYRWEASIHGGMSKLPPPVNGFVGFLLLWMIYLPSATINCLPLILLYPSIPWRLTTSVTSCGMIYIRSFDYSGNGRLTVITSLGFDNSYPKLYTPRVIFDDPIDKPANAIFKPFCRLYWPWDRTCPFRLVDGWNGTSQRQEVRLVRHWFVGRKP